MKRNSQKEASAVVPKGTGGVLLLVAVILAITIAIYILNYTQAPKVAQVEQRESASSGEVSLTFLKPAVVRDESSGGVSLTVLPSGG